MVFNWGGLLGGIAQGIGSIYGGMQAEKGASSANALSYKMFEENIDWQERMYKNRHTYEVADLKNAGLNPVLSANSAGSVPGGSSYAAPQNTKAILAEMAANSAGKAAMLSENLEKVKQEKVKTDIARETKGALVAAIKANATEEAINSARSIKEMEFDKSWAGTKLIQWRRALSLLFGKR